MKFKTTLKIIFASLLTLIVFIACKQTVDNSRENVLTPDPYLDELEEKQIAGTDYYLSIPHDYILETTEGHDFSVYYFFPADSTARSVMQGGLYFGNHPNLFSPYSDSCKTEITKSKILDEEAEWTIYNCGEEYLIQTITDSKSDQGWDELIHAFGRGVSQTDKDKLMSIFTTLKKKH